MNIRSFAYGAVGLLAPLYGIEAQGVRFTLAPAAEYIKWDKKIGIEDDALIGGRIGADFGSLLSASGYYLTRTGLGVTRDSADATTSGILGPLNTKTDITAYGANLALRLSPGRFAPFISVGAGIMRFEADSLPRRDLINYRYGGGFHYDFSPNARAMVMVEDSRFRLPNNALFNGRPSNTGTSGVSTDRNELSNLTYSASLGFAIGGSMGDDSDADRWSAGSIPLEVFAGRLDWDDKSLSRQAMVGARTGVDIGQYVGLRGYYWQGRSGDLKDRQELQSYGGEAQLNLNASLGPAPYLIVGAGRLDFGDDFRDGLGRQREDETALILGGGIGIRLTDQIRLNASARDYVRGPQDLDSISSSSQLTHNWLYSAGLAVNLGRSRSESPRARDERVRAERDRDMRAGYDRMRDDRYNDRTDDRKADDRNRRSGTDTVFVERDPRTGERVLYRRDTRTGRLVRVDGRNGRSDDANRGDDANGRMNRDSDARTITLPVPVNGELYVRYGDSTMRVMPGMMPGMMPMRADSTTRRLRMRLDSLEARNRSEARDSAASSQSDAELRALREQIDRLEAELRTQRMTPTVQPSTNVTVLPGNRGVDRDYDRGGVIIASRDTNALTSGTMINRRDFMGMQLSSVSPYIAGFDALVLGVQADAGPILGISALRFVPDFAIGIGSDPSISLAAGAQYNFPLFNIGENSVIRPHLRASLGFLAASGNADSYFGINIAYGLTYAGRSNLADSRRPQVFIEHQGFDFFNGNRLALGVRMPIR